MNYLLYLTIVFTICIPSLAHFQTYTVERVREGIYTSHAIEKSIIQISFLGKYNTPKYDRKVHTRYNIKENKHTSKYDKSKHNTYNGGQSKKRIKYVKSKHNTYNEKEDKYIFKKHTKKHTKKYYTKYKNYSRHVR